MSQCRSCGGEIAKWVVVGGRNVPSNEDGSDHRDSCPARRGFVPEKLSRVPRRHCGMSQVTRYLRCPRQSYYADVLKLADGSDRTAAESGILVHAAIAYVAVERAKSGRLREPVTEADLLEACDGVVARGDWTHLDAVPQARAQLATAAARIDFSFTAVDEHGPLVERGIEIPVGDGVLAGTTLDMVEYVGDAVLLRDWKTSSHYDAPETKGHDFQAGLSLAWAKQMWPDRDVRFVLDYVVLGETVEIPWSAELDDWARSRARAFVQRLRAKKDDDSELFGWPGRFGSHCNYCAYTKRCETFKVETAKSLNDREPVTLDEVAEELYRWESVATVSGNYVEKLRRLGKKLASEALGSNRGKLLAGRFPVELVSVKKKAEDKPREAYMYQLLKVGDPLPMIVTEDSASLPLSNEAGAARAGGGGEVDVSPPAPVVETCVLCGESLAEERDAEAGVTRIKVRGTLEDGRTACSVCWLRESKQGQRLSVQCGLEDEVKRQSKPTKVPTGGTDVAAQPMVDHGVKTGGITAIPGEALPALPGVSDSQGGGSIPPSTGPKKRRARIDGEDDQWSEVVSHLGESPRSW